MSWMTVGPSFYVAYLNHLELSPEVIGLLTTLRASAGTLARFGFAFLSNYAGVIVATLSGFAIGGWALTMTPFLTAVPLLALVGCLGEAADRLRIPGIYTMIADNTDQGSRALAVALVAVAWAIATTVTPPLLGLIAEKMSLPATFLVAGPFAVLSAVLLCKWNRSVASELPRS
jgi:sugar phosphate permease